MCSGFELVYVRSRDRSIRGWYTVDRTVTDSEPVDWCWNDRGNGPEVTQDGVDGPFATKAEAACDAQDRYDAAYSAQDQIVPGGAP